ncbi:MAG TPA: thiamine pyrophosphate-dependent enzyme [Chloroflexota bacterium]|nr:thiamine pyrophosphate-dependent enzyme [Chloroflexota bacterium]
MTGGQALVESLIREGVDTIFGLPGIQLDYAFDALYGARDSIDVLHTRHEQATCYMADGYARSTGRVGTFLVVPGPGILNTAGALSTAWAVNSPVLAITGQIQSDLIDVGRGVLHEIDDQLGMLRHVTKWAARAATPNEVPLVVHEAFRQLRSGRPRPVEIEIPPDVLQHKADVTLRQPYEPDKAAGDPALLERAAQLLGKAVRPLIVAGGGVPSAEAWDELREVAELLDAPVVMSINGRGSLSDRHPLAALQLALPALLPKADAILAIGTRLVGVGGPPVVAGATAPLVRIDADPTQLNRTLPAAVGIAGDAKLALAELAKRIGKHNKKRESPAAELAAISRILAEELRSADPQAPLGLALRDAIPDDAIVIDESCQVGYWARQGMPLYAPRTYLTSGFQGTLGWGYPTALGAKVGNPDRAVISFNGDGGFMFNVQELATSVQHNIAVPVVVFDDGAFGNVLRIQKESFGGRTIASELKNPSFARLAEVFGMPGVVAKDAPSLRSALKEALTHKGPVMIEVPVGPMPNYQRGMRERIASRFATELTTAPTAVGA